MKNYLDNDFDDNFTKANLMNKVVTDLVENMEITKSSYNVRNVEE